MNEAKTKLPERGRIVFAATGGGLFPAFYVQRLERIDNLDYDDDRDGDDSDYCESTKKYYWPEGWYRVDGVNGLPWRVDCETPVTHWMEPPEPIRQPVLEGHLF